MATITINRIVISPTPAAPMPVLIEYKLTGQPDNTYVTYTPTPTVNPDGTIVGGSLVISGLTPGTSYTIRGTGTCGSYTEAYISSVQTTTTSTTTTIPVTTTTSTTTTAAPTTTTTTTTTSSTTTIACAPMSAMSLEGYFIEL